MSSLLRYRSSTRRRDIPWGVWVGFFGAACLAHVLLVGSVGSALARSFRAYEPKPEEDPVLELDLLNLAEPEPPPELESGPLVEVARNDEPQPKRESKAPTRRPDEPSGAGTKPEQPGSPPPTDEISETNTDPNQDLVQAEDGSSDPRAPTPTNSPGNWGKLGGSTDALKDTFGTRSGAPVREPEGKPGRESILDSKAHLYASFIGRMRERVYEHWKVQAAIDRYDPQGRQLGGITHTTVLLLEIGRDGTIESVRIQVSSGVDYLDDEAVRALKAAGSFPNPPGGLFGEDDSFLISVGLAVEPNGSMRLFRSSQR